MKIQKNKILGGGGGEIVRYLHPIIKTITKIKSVLQKLQQGNGK